MKSSAIILALAGAVAVSAQEIPASLPECGRNCLSSMLSDAKAKELSCSPADYKCLCSNANFGYGIKDCAQQACPQGTDTGPVIAWGQEFCASNGVGSGSGAPGASSIPVATTEIVTTYTSDGKSIETGFTSTIYSLVGGSGAGTDSAAVPSVVSTSTFTTVISSGGSAVSTSTGETVVSGVGSTLTTLTSAIVSTVTSGSSTFESTIGTSTVTTAPGESSSPSSESAATSNTSSGLGAQMTAAPIAGFLAAAGIAVALL